MTQLDSELQATLAEQPSREEPSLESAKLASPVPHDGDSASLANPAGKGAVGASSPESTGQQVLSTNQNLT